MSLKYMELEAENPEASRDEILAMCNPDFDSFRNVADEVTAKVEAGEDVDESLVEIAEQELRTKQSFADSCDVNKILKKAQQTGVISHYEMHKRQYGDFESFDFLEASLKITKGREIFEALPSEVRNEFGNSPAAFFSYVNDPENKLNLDKLLPAIAEPGAFFPNPVKRTVSMSRERFGDFLRSPEEPGGAPDPDPDPDPGDG